MQQLFEVASNVSTPLALGGFFAAVVFAIFKQIVTKNIFPRLNEVLGAEILKLIVERLFILALIAMVLGFVAYVVVRLIPPPIPDRPSSSLPPRFDDIRSAELRVSDVDDYLRLMVNDEALPTIVFGQSVDPIPIKRLLHRGSNRIVIGIDNGIYGGCGATVELWFNGRTDDKLQWHWWKDIDKAPANANCFTFVKNVYLP